MHIPPDQSDVERSDGLRIRRLQPKRLFGLDETARSTLEVLDVMLTKDPAPTVKTRRSERCKSDIPEDSSVVVHISSRSP